MICQTFAASLPLRSQFDSNVGGVDIKPTASTPNEPKYNDSSNPENEQVISVRITSSVAVGRGRSKSTTRSPSLQDYDFKDTHKTSPTNAQHTFASTTEDTIPMSSTDIPPNLVGANIEYIKQLNAKKETKEHSTESIHPFQYTVNNQNDNEPLYEDTDKLEEYDDEMKYVPIARKIPSAADANQFYDQKMHKPDNTDKIPVTNLNAQNQTKLSDLLDESLAMETSTIDYENNNKNDGNATALPMMEPHTERRDINKLTPDGTKLLNTNYQSDDSIAESSIKSVEFTKTEEGIGNIPQTGKVPLPGTSQNYVQGLRRRPLNEGRASTRLTTVSFNIVHDTPKTTPNNNEPINPYTTQSQPAANPPHFYDPPTIYSQPAQIYSEPAKFYSEPAKIYSEPAKIYSEPAKVYSEPAKIYSEPAKFYSEPASLHLEENVPPSIPPNYSPWQPRSQRPSTRTTVHTTPLSTGKTPPELVRTQMEHQPEKNYEVDEKISVLTDGRSHGVQETTTEKCKQDNCKVGYVVQGRQFKKYQVEERTSDGFIVGEYGVVRNEDGALRGVRYTADSDASPRLIQDALMKFLQL